MTHSPDPRSALQCQNYFLHQLILQPLLYTSVSRSLTHFANHGPPNRQPDDELVRFRIRRYRRSWVNGTDLRFVACLELMDGSCTNHSPQHGYKVVRLVHDGISALCAALTCSLAQLRVDVGVDQRAGGQIRWPDDDLCARILELRKIATLNILKLNL
jgi:hypothetical protein